MTWKKISLKVGSSLRHARVSGFETLGLRHGRHSAKGVFMLQTGKMMKSDQRLSDLREGRN